MRNFLDPFLALVLMLLPVQLIADCGSLPVSLPSPNLVYRNVPFGSGEKAVYLASYVKGIDVGYINFEVGLPEQHLGLWHMMFSVSARSGDWYRKVIDANYFAKAWTVPNSFQASQFILTEDLKPLFVKNYYQDKLLKFNHTSCKVEEEVKNKNKEAKTSVFSIDDDATDILAAIYKLRTISYKIGKEERFKVYTSEKNWWLSATPEEFVSLNVPYGTHEAVKLNLQTFIGKDLQQKGEVKVWVATKLPQRPILKFKLDVKIGFFDLKLKEFRASLP